MVIDRCKRTGRNINEERELTMIVRVEQYDASAFYILVPTYVDYSEKIQFKFERYLQHLSQMQVISSSSLQTED